MHFINFDGFYFLSLFPFIVLFTHLSQNCTKKTGINAICQTIQNEYYSTQKLFSFFQSIHFCNIFFEIAKDSFRLPFWSVYVCMLESNVLSAFFIYQTVLRSNITYHIDVYLRNVRWGVMSLRRRLRLQQLTLWIEDQMRTFLSIFFSRYPFLQ